MPATARRNMGKRPIKQKSTTRFYVAYTRAVLIPEQFYGGTRLSWFGKEEMRLGPFLQPGNAESAMIDVLGSARTVPGTAHIIEEPIL